EGRQACLDVLIQGMGTTGLLLLLNFRPEHGAAWLEKVGGARLPLVPLSPAAIGELLSDLLGGDPSLASLAERIRERTGGNPFFIEEVVRSLVDHGVLVAVPDGSGAGEDRSSLSPRRRRYALAQPLADIQIPATVQAVLGARIDRLSERDKMVLQTAAVIGKRFWEPVLRRVLDMSEENLGEALRALTAAEFIYTDVIYPEPEYAFQHPLTRECAYVTQLGEHRGRVHAAVARAIADLYPDRL